MLLATSSLKHLILVKLRSLAMAGHSRFHKTYARAQHSFFWLGIKRDILNFVFECDICQCNKGELIKPLGTLQPLPIPTSISTDISMYFIVGFLKVGNKWVIMLVVDRLSKYAHFVHLCTLSHWLWSRKFSWIIFLN